ncbi:MAG: hypothetical protein K2G35_01705 [Duncaniella sp.]|nr:hypothetical protein [Duncaniella sp.]
MVNKKVIAQLYKQFPKPPKSADELNIGLLFDYCFENHGIVIDENELFIGSVEPGSPFSCLPLRLIHEIVEFDKVVAIVLHSSIIFLNKEDSGVNIHLNLADPKTGLWQRLMATIRGEKEDDFDDVDIDELDIMKEPEDMPLDEASSKLFADE